MGLRTGMMADAFTLHKPIRNRICQYDRDALLDLALTALLKHENDLGKNLGYVPWECMLLIRWVLQYGTPGHHLKKPTIQVLNVLLNEIKQLYDAVSPIDPKEPHWVNKFMRRTAFQQLSYQISPIIMGWKVGRQLVLFEEIGAQYGVDQKFKEATGLSIKKFIAISFALFAFFEVDQNVAFDPSLLMRTFRSEDIKLYLDLVSVTPEQARKFLTADHEKKGKRFLLQLYEVSPLVRKPLLLYGNRYIPFSKRLFRMFVTNFIYDLLFGLPDHFGAFGDILEKYVRQGLETNGFKPLYDKQWKKILDTDISAPDFTIPQLDATTFIEVKRKDLHEIPKVMQTNETMSRHLDDSIVKGVLQIYSLASKISQARPDCVTNFDNLFGIVVSYRDHYLRGGKQFWDEFLYAEIMSQLSTQGINLDIIPAENIFLLSVDEFDFLMSFMKQYPEETFNSILSKVKEFEADPGSSSFFFQDHLVKIKGSADLRPEHLWDRMQAVIDEVIEDMRQYEAQEASIIENSS